MKHKAENMDAIRTQDFVGISSKTWSEAAKNAVEEAARTVGIIRSIEIGPHTAVVENQQLTEYHITIRVSYNGDS